MTILVTGATGTVGHHVVAELVRRDERVRALTRDPAKADFPDGVEVVRGDLSDPATLAPALEGVTGLHLITFGGAQFAPLTTGAEIVALAAKAGVRRITVLHGGGPSPMEDAVRAGDVDWTVVMPVEFMANALEWAEGIRAGDGVSEPFTGRLSAMVHEADIGAVAAAALTEDGHARRAYVLSGPEVLTVRDKVRVLSEARGGAIALTELTEEQAVARWQAAGMDAGTVGFMLEVYGNTPEVGRTVVDMVERLTGRPARTFAEWAREHAAAFRAA